jgi:hypothetical protein
MSRLYSSVRLVIHFIDNRQFLIFQYFKSQNCRFQVFGKEKPVTAGSGYLGKKKPQ